MKIFLFFSLLFGLNAREILWSDTLVSLIEENGLPAVTLNRTVSFEQITDQEKIDLERTVGKMQTVFEHVFGFGDFVRWMPLNDQQLISYLIPSGGYSSPDEIDYDLKVRVMLFTLKDHKELLSPLSEEEINAIQQAAVEILPYPQPDIILVESNLPCTKIEEGLSHAFKELNHTSELVELPSFSPNFSTACKVFCNETILTKQHVYKSEVNHLLYNYQPYVDCHFMVIPRRHLTTLSESSDAEILDKYLLFSKVKTLAKCPKVAIITRMGWRAGQTQSHLHDHIIGFDPQIEQPWIFGWVRELTGKKKSIDPEKWETTRLLWQNFFYESEL